VAGASVPEPAGGAVVGTLLLLVRRRRLR
jgi:hypothetical protein